MFSKVLVANRGEIAVRIIGTCKKLVVKTVAEAVHPGYGFLSEFHQFAEAVEKTGAVWIGPAVEVMKKVESKTYSRRVAREIGVPTIPGAYEPITGKEMLEKLLEEHGPLLIKPDAGGGGKGTRKATDPKAAVGMLEAASREA